MKQPQELEFGKLLKAHRKAQGLTQSALAQETHLTASYISKLERHDRPPPEVTAFRLAAELGLSDEEKRTFIQAARHARARHLESMGLKAAARLLARVPSPPQRIRRPIGRDEEIESIVDRVSESGVILNITGDPAIGKTTVALEVAHRCWDQGRIVLWGDAREGTAETVAQVEALVWNSVVGGRIPDSEVQRHKRLSAALSEVKPLIVLDNLESAREFTGILDFAKQIGKDTSVLITSRRWIPAHIGENIPLLELPKDDGIQLFETVGEAYGRHAVTEKDLRIIEVICTDLLAGHPGAIEIAASLWKGWPLEAILRGLKQRSMETLKDPHRTDINRSMRLSIGLSYDLLREENPEACELFPRLSVFQASFRYQVVEVVTGISEPLPALEFLVDRSLVRFDGKRHSLHSVVREFAVEKLGKAREEYELSAAQYFLAFAEEHESDFDRLDEEKGNLFAVLDWAEAHAEHRTIAIDLIELLFTFMYRRGLWTERLRRVQRALQIAELIGDREEIIRLRYVLGNSYRNLGDDENAKEQYESGLALAREMDHPRHIGAGLLFLAELAFRAQDHLRVRELCGQAIGFLEQAEATAEVALAFSLLGSGQKELGNPDEARSCFEKGVALARQLEDTNLMSILLEDLCRLDIESQDFANAKLRAQEYEKFAQQAGDPLLEGIALLIWATLMCEKSYPEEAKSYFQAAVSHFERVGIPMKAVEAREGLVLVATTQLNDVSLAEEQLGAIASTYLNIGNNEKAAFAFYRLGLVQEDLNKPGHAKVSYEKALSLYSSLGILDDPKIEEMTVRLDTVRKQLTSLESDGVPGHS